MRAGAHADRFLPGVQAQHGGGVWQRQLHGDKYYIDISAESFAAGTRDACPGDCFFSRFYPHAASPYGLTENSLADSSYLKYYILYICKTDYIIRIRVCRTVICPAYMTYLIGGKALELTWMGRYRELVRALVFYSNNSNRGVLRKQPSEREFHLTQHEYQILEYICEFEDSNRIMTDISKDLGILQSNITKATKHLLELGLIERYRIPGNKKNIVLKPTALGLETYGMYCSEEIKPVFTQFFETLDGFSDEQLAQFEKAIWSLSRQWGALSDKPLEKIE